jgi:hypothetical protein
MQNRIMTLVAALSLAALAGCGGTPGGPDDMGLTAAPTPAAAPLAPKDRLVAAIETNNCVLTADNVESILLQANLTQDQLRSLTPELAAEGRAEVAATGTIRVLTDNCI